MSASRRFVTPAAALAVLFSAVHAPADDPKKGGGEPPAPKRPGNVDPELYGIGGRPFELVIRGDRSRFGRFDADGNFIPEPIHESYTESHEFVTIADCHSSGPRPSRPRDVCNPEAFGIVRQAFARR